MGQVGKSTCRALCVVQDAWNGARARWHIQHFPSGFMPLCRFATATTQEPRHAPSLFLSRRERTTAPHAQCIRETASASWTLQKRAYIAAATCPMLPRELSPDPYGASRLFSAKSHALWAPALSLKTSRYAAAMRSRSASSTQRASTGARSARCTRRISQSSVA